MQRGYGGAGGRSPPLLEAVTERVSGAQELVIMHMRMHAHAESELDIGL